MIWVTTGESVKANLKTPKGCDPQSKNPETQTHTIFQLL